MRKLFLIVALIFALMIPGMCLGAGSSHTVSSDKVYRNAETGDVLRVITCIFTADSANGSIPDLSITSQTANINYPVIGWYLYKVRIDCNHAGTEPTENSEIYAYEGGFDLLKNAGVDQVDNSDEREVLCYPATQPIIMGTLTVTVTQQATATNSATGTYYLVFYSDGGDKQ
jgi:hypothetical protein